MTSLPKIVRGSGVPLDQNLHPTSRKLVTIPKRQGTWDNIVHVSKWLSSMSKNRYCSLWQ